MAKMAKPRTAHSKRNTSGHKTSKRKEECTLHGHIWEIGCFKTPFKKQNKTGGGTPVVRSDYYWSLWKYFQKHKSHQEKFPFMRCRFNALMLLMHPHSKHPELSFWNNMFQHLTPTLMRNRGFKIKTSVPPARCNEGHKFGENCSMRSMASPAPPRAKSEDETPSTRLQKQNKAMDGTACV